MRLTCEPPWPTWQPASTPHTLEPLEPLLQYPAGVANVSTVAPVFATGHQAYLFHPGILAKYLALSQAASRLGAQPLHIIVDQDVHDALTLALPVNRSGALAVHVLRLASQQPDVALGMHPPADPSEVVASLEHATDALGDNLTADLSPIINAWTDPPDAPNLAAQIAHVLARLMSPYIDPAPFIFASDLLPTAQGRQVVEHMLSDAAICIAAYNRAVSDHPQAGLSPLRMARDHVELPLWWLAPARPRRRIYADLADSNPMLTFADGEPVPTSSDENDNGPGRLVPRALLLTALMRSRFCDRFIHGRGGGVYDQATSQWWTSWTGETLALDAVVSADLTLTFDAPRADQQQYERAIWYAHHLPHNIDRALAPEAADRDPRIAQKRDLLQHMGDDRDRRRRYAAFREIHRINDELTHDHSHLIQHAQAELSRAQQGLANRAIAAKRDWCFALYPPEQLHQLRDAIAHPSTLTAT